MLAAITSIDSLGDGVTVAQQILVLLVQVRILVAQLPFSAFFPARHAHDTLIATNRA